MTMLIALMSDTHDHIVNTRAALELLAPHKPAAYLHAGDLVSPSMLDLFKGLPFHFVFGNNEYDFSGLRSRAMVHGVTCHGELADLTLAGKRIAVTHGHTHTFRKTIRSGEFQYVVYGHTHLIGDERIGTTRVINPGALQRAQKKTVALLNLATDDLQFLPLPPAP
jgi:uncharacterized protein